MTTVLLTELWKLKDKVHFILLSYEDNCRFSLTDNQYRGVYSEFNWWNSQLDVNPTKLADQHYTKEAPFVTYLVHETSASCTGWGVDTEESIVNLLKAASLLTQNKQIIEIYNQAKIIYDN